MEVKNGIIIDGVLHEVVNYSNDYDCIICSLHKECDEFERKYKIHLCNMRLLKVAFALILMVLFNKRTTITR